MSEREGPIGWLVEWERSDRSWIRWNPVFGEFWWSRAEAEREARAGAADGYYTRIVPLFRGEALYFDPKEMTNAQAL